MTKAAISNKGEAIINGEFVPTQEFQVLTSLDELTRKLNSNVRAVELADHASMRGESVRTYLERLRLRGLVTRTNIPGQLPRWDIPEPVKLFFHKVRQEN